MATPNEHTRQLVLALRKRGGRRRGAGRPARGARASEPHRKRPEHKGRYPVHVTTRVAQGIPRLRSRLMFLAIREATIRVVGRDDFRIVHLSIQANHLHLIVETSDKASLAKGMQAFLGSAAKQIKAALRATQARAVPRAVFPDRYHLSALTTPRAVRHAVAYVLNNWRRHREDRGGSACGWKLDRYSSAIDFAGWAGLADSSLLYRAPDAHLSLIVRQPRTWLLRIGWLQHHSLISEREVPGPRTRVAT